jgi:hypothetical protein
MGLRWPVAVGLNAALLVMVDIVARPGGLPEGYAPISTAATFAIAAVLPALYLGSTAARTLLRRKRVTPFETVQGPAALLIGVAGIVKLGSHAGKTATPLGFVLLVLGGAAYAAAFAFIDRRTGRGRNFYFYTTLAAVLALAGSNMILDNGALVLTWCGLAIAALWLGGRYDRVTLRFHGVVYVLASGVVAGLLATTYDSLFGDPAGMWRPLVSAGLATALVTVAGYGILLAARRIESQLWALLPQAIMGTLVAWIIAGMAAKWLTGVLGDVPRPGADLALVATTRTAVLAGLAVALAWASRRFSLRELGWLVYPVLVGGAVRLLVEDMRYGRPVTLFFSLGLYGAALIVAPRLMKKAGERRGAFS